MSRRRGLVEGLYDLQRRRFLGRALYNCSKGLLDDNDAGATDHRDPTNSEVWPPDREIIGRSDGSSDSAFGFHPIIETWFRSRFSQPTEAQIQGWPSILAGDHTLIAAPTGSGKTLAAFLACIDRLLKRSLEGPLEEDVRVVYVSPLRALSNDMHRNLEVPLAEIAAQAEAMGFPRLEIHAGLRTETPRPPNGPAWCVDRHRFWSRRPNPST